MQNNKIKTIKNLWIVDCIVSCIQIVLLIVALIGLFSSLNQYIDSAIGSGSTTADTSIINAFSAVSWGRTLLIATILISIPRLALQLSHSILILATSWEIKEIEDERLLWGLLDLLLLGWIGACVFTTKANKHLINTSNQ